MRVLVRGAGPGGLTFAAALNEDTAAHTIHVVDTRSERQLPGWGITLPAPHLEMLGLLPQAEEIASLTVSCGGRPLQVVADWRLHGIERARLVTHLATVCTDRGVPIQYGSSALSSLEESSSYDLIVHAEGAGSPGRRELSASLDATIETHGTLYAWHAFGRQVQDTGGLRLSCRRHPTGSFLLWTYPYSRGRSTAIVQCTTDTAKALSEQAPESWMVELSQLFREELRGSPLLGAATPEWSHFRQVRTAQPHHGRAVLLGDALHTTHFSRGFGTMLAMDDALCLAEKLIEGAHLGIDACLEAFAQERMGTISGAQDAAARSMLVCDEVLHAMDRDDQTSAESALLQYLALIGAATPAPHDDGETSS